VVEAAGLAVLGQMRLGQSLATAVMEPRLQFQAHPLRMLAVVAVARMVRLLELVGPVVVATEVKAQQVAMELQTQAAVVVEELAVQEPLVLAAQASSSSLTPTPTQRSSQALVQG
jgi:predicted GNAT family N-acyltransferase